ncbi:MAG: hypothetical protein Q4D55_09840 [Eubacteriales bacterium]|nr:hypothetical protein [Eubacteriales bacterium]
MDLFEDPKKRFIRRLKFFFPVLFLAAVCLIFFAGISRTSSDSLEKERTTLARAISGGAVRTYALTGAYPESLDSILEDYHITYDREKFLVEYVPNGANLLPSITVLLLRDGKGERP